MKIYWIFSHLFLSFYFKDQNRSVGFLKVKIRLKLTSCILGL